MKVLVYEGGMGGSAPCVYQTETAEVEAYAKKAYNGECADDIVFDADNFGDYEIDFDNKKVICYDTLNDKEVEYGFDIAVDADELEE